MRSFGGLMLLGYHYADQPEAWRHSLELLAQEVMPNLEVELAQPVASARLSR